MFVQKWEGAGMYLHRHVSTVSLVISPKYGTHTLLLVDLPTHVSATIYLGNHKAVFYLGPV